MTQQQIDWERAEQDRRAREREAEQERQRAEAERRAREREAEERRLNAIRRLAEDTDQCRRYVVAGCDSALASAYADPGERARLSAWRETAVQYATDYAACRDGSASACTAALASPALSDRHREELEQWRAQTSLMHRAIGFVKNAGGTAASSAQSLVATVRELPTSTHVAGGIAAGLALALIALVVTRRRGQGELSPPPEARTSEPARAPTPPGGGVVPEPEQAQPGAEQPSQITAGEREPAPESRLAQPAAPQAPRPPPRVLAAAKEPAVRVPANSVGPSVVLGNTPTFVILYLLVMLPTYFLPYLGSNSVALNSAGRAAGVGMNPAFWLHLAALAALVAIGLSRARYIGRSWLTIFPLLALVFDLAPGLSFIPLVPTVMHLLMIILGVALASGTPGSAGANVPGPGGAGTDGYDRSKFEALLNYDADVRTAAARIRPLGEKWIAVLARDYMTLNSKEYLPSIVSKIEAEAAREQAERQDRPFVVEEGIYRDRKWRRLNTGVIEAEMLNGGVQQFGTIEEFKRYVE